MMKKYWKIIVPVLFALAAVFAVIHYNIPNLFGFRTSIKKFADTSDGSLQGYLNQAQNLSPRGSQASSSTTFLAVGDIMLSRNVAAFIRDKTGPTHGEASTDAPFLKMANFFKSTDFNFANLESPFDPKEAGIIGGHSMIFSAPLTTINGLIDYNFKVLNLANNHAFDQGLAGLDYTREVLTQNNIQHEGTGDNLDEAWTPAVINAKGIKIGFLGASYASINDSGKTQNNYVARTDDLNRLKSSILNLKSKSDFIVVTMHAGTEYTRTPNAAQVIFAHAAIDAGADMVIGSHPHWVQTVEKYQGKYIFYSLGNFIFDQMWSQETKEGLTLKITLSKNSCHPDRPNASEGVEGSLNTDDGSNLRDSSAALGMTNIGECADTLQGSRTPAKLDSIELLPVIIENYSTPRPATTDESKKILDKINQNTNILQ
jgi:poly-gamma-glutamate synthesis protein (capsule biosynthesis protein)